MQESNNRFTVALVQTDSGPCREENLARACQAIDEASSHGAQLICFPEHMDLMTLSPAPENCEPPLESGEVGEAVATLAEHAKANKVYVHCGSFFERIEGDTRFYNTSVLIEPDGGMLARYRKLHAFDVTLPDGTEVRESDRMKPGTEIVTVSTPLATFGFAICYDLRFPELFRALALKGAQVIFCPANFTQPTGQAHWETLVRARAIENGCYIVAPGQCGEKPEFVANGNSMVVDPWGTVLARGGNEPTILYANIDLDELNRVRSALPCLANRRNDVYGNLGTEL